MNNLKQYISNLSYDYVETYSGLRGFLFQEFVDKVKSQMSDAKLKIKSARFMERQKLSKEITSLKDKIYAINSRLINLDGQKHESAELICKLERGDLRLIQLCDTLRMKYESHSVWMCAPTYRDSIVFYKEDNIIGIVNICFGCKSIQDESQNSFLADSKLYPSLKNQLVELGHNIVDDRNIRY